MRKPTRRLLKQTRSASYERKFKETPAITPIEYGGLQEAYDHFNRELFGGNLSRNKLYCGDVLYFA